eukprot:CAMPEP_0174277456 /NCGR_PEP_ID=MMETSP0439-20130205/60943_1 /TAXON_ID=0 /ORGANISM="Stereomyxa ramosa, Strain Chinc5" /LENGTH=187 /DNA_ID=CAMNT_0015369779 /DNA_START=649 /DNA_END=1212 /DNA_ORIENTATION=-
MPVQRVPRYIMLLQDMKSRSSGLIGTAIYDHLDKAIKKLQYTTTFINELKRDNENAALVKDLITTKFSFSKKLKKEESLFQQGADKRRFLREGPVYVKKNERHAFVFSDFFTITKRVEKKDGYIVSTLVPLDGVEIDTICTGEKYGSFGFATEDKKYTFYVSDDAESEAWARALRIAISDISKKKAK